jgi:hypothetical protein
MADYGVGKSGNDWVAVQQKTFTRWCNVQLGERLMKIDDLLTDLSTGVLLCNVLEIISDKKVKHRKKVRNNFDKAENLNSALRFLRGEGIVLVNTGQEDISAGNQRIILGMIWTIILRYQIQKGEGGRSPKDDLLQWVNNQIAPYDGVRECKNFTRDFQSGEVLNALCDSLENGTIDMGPVVGGNPMRNCAQALNTADEKFDIPPILDPIDIVNVPDEHSMMTYVSYFRAYEANRAKDGVPKASCCFADGPGVEGGKQGVGPLPFVIHTMNRKNRPIDTPAEYTVEAFSPDGKELPVTIVDNGDGTVNGEYEPTMPGSHRVVISLGSAQIKGSVYKPYVKPSADPAQSYAEGPGLVEARDDEDGIFTVYARDPEGAPVPNAPVNVQVQQADGSLVDATVEDQNDGSYSVNYGRLCAGPATIFVRLNEDDIKDTPVTVEVTKGINSANTYADGPGVEPRGFCGRPLPFVIHACDEDGEPLTKGNDSFAIDFKGPNGPINVNCEDQKDGTYPCEYTAPMNAAGTALLNITNNRDNEQIKDAPFQIELVLPADHSKSYAEGPGLEKAWNDRANTFTIYAIDRNNQPVSGEDVKVLLAYGETKAAPVRAAPTRSNEPEFIEKQVEQIAKFCASCGEGNQRAKFCWNCGAKNRKKIVTQRVPNPNFGKVSSPTPARGASGVDYTHEGQVVDNGDGTYSASYVTEPEQTAVTVNVHIYGKEIRGVPVHLNITKGPCAEQCYAEGPGVEQGFAGRPNRFRVYAMDEDGNPISCGGDDFQVTVTDPNGENIPCFLRDLDNGTYAAQYIPTTEGDHTVQVDLVKDKESTPIKDMPTVCSIRNGASGRNSYMKGKGLRWAYEGRANTFTVHAFDDNGQPVAGEKIDLLIVLASVYDENDIGNKLLRDTTNADYADFQTHDDLLAEIKDDQVCDASTLNARSIVIPTVTDNGNGVYTVNYEPTITGDYVIDCRFYDEHVQKSPARLAVYFNCPHQQCQDAMAVLHNELLSYEENRGDSKEAHSHNEEELKSLRAILAGKQQASNEGMDELRQQLEDERLAREAAELEIARLREQLGL